MERVTAMTSLADLQNSYLAVAGLDFENPEMLTVEIFTTTQKKIEN
jgi:hypothetical protein